MNWIKVEDKSPELTEHLMWWNDRKKISEILIKNQFASVLAYNTELGIFKAQFSKMGWSEISSISSKGNVKPTHWMPLPEIPKN